MPSDSLTSNEQLANEYIRKNQHGLGSQSRINIVGFAQWLDKRPTPETPQPSASKPMTPGQRETHVRWLTVMLEYYSGEEATLRARLDEREVWGEGQENEWRRYQAEAAALRAAIEALHPSDETGERLAEQKSMIWQDGFLACAELFERGRVSELRQKVANINRGALKVNKERPSTHEAVENAIARSKDPDAKWTPEK